MTSKLEILKIIRKVHRSDRAFKFNKQRKISIAREFVPYVHDTLTENVVRILRLFEFLNNLYL